MALPSSSKVVIAKERETLTNNKVPHRFGLVSKGLEDHAASSLRYVITTTADANCHLIDPRTLMSGLVQKKI
jgi:hypothetical protein